MDTTHIPKRRENNERQEKNIPFCWALTNPHPTYAKIELKE